VDPHALDALAERLPRGRVTDHHGEVATHARDRWALALLREARGARVPPPAASAKCGVIHATALKLAHDFVFALMLVS